jgi:DNA modification methylase
MAGRKVAAAPVAGELEEPGVAVAPGDAARARRLWVSTVIERLPLEALEPYARNSRLHSERQVEALAASIAAFGFTNPVLIDADGVIVAGHGRVLAARRLELEEVPCIRLAHLSEAERRAYVIADNQLTLGGSSWDLEVLASEVRAVLEAEAVPSLALGFEDAELAALVAGELAALQAEPPRLDALIAGVSEDEGAPVEEPGADVSPAPEPVSKPGDLWLLGSHRLICGDSTAEHTVSELLAGETPELMVTDPPYGVAYDATWRETAGISAMGPQRGEVLANDTRADWRDAWALFPGSVAYVWHGSLATVEVAQSLTQSAFELRSLIIWAKNMYAVGRGHYHWQHEPAWYGVRKGRSANWQGARDQSTLWEIPNMAHAFMRSKRGPEDQREEHSTQKPVLAMARPILNHTKPGDAVYEPFSGSGTTIIAAEQTGRRALAVELEPRYVDMAVERWQRYSGKEAVLASTGESYNALKAREREHA